MNGQSGPTRIAASPSTAARASTVGDGASTSSQTPSPWMPPRHEVGAEARAEAWKGLLSRLASGELEAIREALDGVMQTADREDGISAGDERKIIAAAMVTRAYSDNSSIDS